MKKLFSIILLSSCISTKQPVQTVTECDDDAAKIWIQECIESQMPDSASEKTKWYIKTDCQKQAKEIFCKQVKK